MPAITYVLPDGSERVLDIPPGQSVMEGSVRNNLPGIVAECGGSCSCATCHVFVCHSSPDTFDEATREERDLIEFLDDAAPNSRLACQLIVSEAAAGTRVLVAKSNE